MAQEGLFHLMFGAQAETARENASERLLRWAGLFESWLSERKGETRIQRISAVRAWRKYLGILHKPPWEGQESDVYALLDLMEEEGKSAYSIGNHLTEIASFYRYAQEHAAAGEAVRNPAEGVPHPAKPRYLELGYLSEEKAQRLLGAAREQEGPVGKRDYALILMQLSGPLRWIEIRELKWGDVEWGGGGDGERGPA